MLIGALTMMALAATTIAGVAQPPAPYPPNQTVHVGPGGGIPAVGNVGGVHVGGLGGLGGIGGGVGGGIH